MLVKPPASESSAALAAVEEAKRHVPCTRKVCSPSIAQRSHLGSGLAKCWPTLSRVGAVPATKSHLAGDLVTLVEKAIAKTSLAQTR